MSRTVDTLRVDLGRAPRAVCATFTCRDAATLRVELAYCQECDDTARACHEMHRTSHDVAHICDACGLLVRQWECLTAISTLPPASAGSAPSGGDQ